MAITSSEALLKGRPWAEEQLSGPPDCPERPGTWCSSWSPAKPQAGDVTVELDFEEAVEPEEIRIHESIGPGTVVRVEARDGEGAWTTIWEGRSRSETPVRWFEPPLRECGFRSSTIRLTLATDADEEWNELDAVELIGNGVRQWASAARASSTYRLP